MLIEDTAASLRAAYVDGPIRPVRAALPEGDIDAAYRVQAANTRFWVDAGRRIVGRKIGLTSKAVQTQLSVEQPDFGVLFYDMAVPDGERVAASRLLQPRAEAEVALALARDLTGEHFTSAELIAAVDFALPAMEIVDSRIARWDIGIVDTIADNASAGLFVTGNDPRPLGELDLRLCGMVLSRNGTPASLGVGAACLGHPLKALRWLATTLARAGEPLRAGDIVLSGALGPLVPVASGDHLRVEIGGLGRCEIAFE